jgi:hypothetical protein
MIAVTAILHLVVQSEAHCLPRYRLLPMPWGSRAKDLVATRGDRGRNFKDKREYNDKSPDTS